MDPPCMQHNRSRKLNSTSIHGGHKVDSRLLGVSEDVRRVSVPCMGHHSGEEVVEAGHHRGHRKDDEGDSLQSEVEEGCDGRSHHVHNSRGGAEQASVPCNGRGGCNREAREISCHTHR